jgi:flagellar biosynthesis repressor protein FlbT
VSLVLDLRAGEVMIVNSAPLRFRTRSRIELTAQARFMFGKQIMAPDQANSPARRIYFALQSAYIGEETEREAGLESARHFIEEFQQATTSEMARQLLTRALVAAESDDLHEALQLTRRVVQHEDAIIGNSPREPQRFEASVAPPRPDELGTRIALRRDKTRRSWMGFAHLAVIMINLRLTDFSHRA